MKTSKDVNIEARNAIERGETPEQVFDVVRARANGASKQVDAPITSAGDTSTSTSGMQHIASLLAEALKTPLPRLDTGYPEFDQALDGGFVPGCLGILAALTSNGKSTIALNIALSMALRGTPSAIISLEDSQTIVSHKLLSMSSRVELAKISKGTLDAGDRKRIDDANEHLAKCPLYFSETASLEGIKRDVEHAVKMGVHFVIIDQLHHVTLDRNANPYERISTVTRGLQRLAAQSGVALLVCHQCNRKAEDDTELKLHHLRDSGTIEQDARLVLLVTKCERDELDSTKPAVLTLKVAKNSHGPRGREFRLLAHFDRASIDNYFPVGVNE